MKTMSMWDIVRLGEDLQVLIVANVFHAQIVIDARSRVVAALASLDLAPEHNTCQKVKDYPLPTNNIGSFTTLSTSLHDHVHAETTKRELALLRTTDVSAQLRAFSTRPDLTEIQRRLADETVRCLQIEAYRSAMVMGWNLVYDILRTWIVADTERLGMFNANLRSVNSGRSQISKYLDFIYAEKPPSESDVLKSCRGENGQNAVLPEGIVSDFQQGLRRRNDYAHPNFADPQLMGSHAYVEDLVRIVSNPPFADPSQSQPGCAT
jgi:hypothetical protein